MTVPSIFRPGLHLVRICLAATLLCSGLRVKASSQFVLACSPENDLFTAMKTSGLKPKRYRTPLQAVSSAPRGATILLLADEYPTNTLALSADIFQLAAERGAHLYVEFPSFVPGMNFSQPQKTTWERFVVHGDSFGNELPALHILMAHECYFLRVQSKANALINVARVAGYDTALYGMPANAPPVLLSLAGGRTLIATTRLSGFIRGRFAPSKDWRTLWNLILRHLSENDSIELTTSRPVEPMYGPTEALPPNHEQQAFQQATAWIYNSQLLLPESRVAEVHSLLKSNQEQMEAPAANSESGDGRFGILEGYASRIRADGSQPQRTPIRADCQAESAMVLAMDSSLHGTRKSSQTASNLLDFLYFNSDLCGEARGNPAHPAYGLIGWGSVSPTWRVANYGDDNARAMLATMLAAAGLASKRWDEPLLRALYANLRTTGPSGFRGDRIDLPQLEQKGWRHYQDTPRVNLSPAFEAYSWACFLWAYQHTNRREFLDKTKIGIRMTMEAFPEKWRWNDNSERARMLLCLAWLVRVEDTGEHRRWLQLVAEDLIKIQQPNGAIPEQFRGAEGSHYSIPKSNEAYGTGETPLLQKNGDPVTDQLYVSGFAFLAFHEAAAATGDEHIRAAEDKLAEYLCRIQIRSKSAPQLHGTWFRAFDFVRWEPWASSGDFGWGPWCLEAGWGQSWTAAVLALRQKHASLWEITSDARIAERLSAVDAAMAQNNGAPWGKESTRR